MRDSEIPFPLTFSRSSTVASSFLSFLPPAFPHLFLLVTDGHARRVCAVLLQNGVAALRGQVHLQRRLNSCAPP